MAWHTTATVTRAILAVAIAVTTGAATAGCACPILGQRMADRGREEGTLSGQKTPEPTKPEMLSEHQAMDQIAGAALVEVFGGAWIERAWGAPDGESFISIEYTVEKPPVKGDGQRVMDELISSGAKPDPDKGEVDYHYGSEQVTVLVDIDNEKYPKMRFDITPGKKRVFVNALPATE